MNLTTALLQRVLPTSRLYGFVGGRQGIPVIDCHEDGINITASFAIDTRTSVYDTRPMQAGEDRKSVV